MFTHGWFLMTKTVNYVTVTQASHRRQPPLLDPPALCLPLKRGRAGPSQAPVNSALAADDPGSSDESDLDAEQAIVPMELDVSESEGFQPAGFMDDDDMEICKDNLCESFNMVL